MRLGGGNSDFARIIEMLRELQSSSREVDDCAR